MLNKPQNRRPLFFALVVGAILLAATWLIYRSAVHPEFGHYRTARMSESYKETQTRGQKAEATVRGWLHIPPRRPRSKEGYDNGLEVGPAILGWSIANNRPEKRDGYIYMVDVEPSGHGAPLWEFALSRKTRLGAVSWEDLRCDYYGKDDPQGTNVFGKAWNGRTIQVPEGQIFFARLRTNPPVVYVIRLTEQGGKPSYGTMRIDYLVATNRPVR